MDGVEALCDEIGILRQGKIVGVFPLTQGIGLMKAAFLGLPIQNVWLPVGVMVGVTVVCTGIAFRFFRWE